MEKNFYITTTLPYVNSDPHVGFAMEIVRADAIARAKVLQGFNVFFNTGTDEHGAKLQNDADKAGREVKEYVDEYAEKFRGLKQVLNIHPDVHFIRTTDSHHCASAQEFWRRCDKAGYIYKKTYQSKYCVGCELEKTDSELVEGHCPIHPKMEIEVRDEENYFFKFSAFEDRLLDLYDRNPRLVIPEFRFNEIKSFVKAGLQDFSISRLKSKMSWGVEVPGDSEHTMYVWFDALVNYISTLGWPKTCFGKTSSAEHSSDECFRPEEDLFTKFWANGTPVQYCGKDNIRQQAAMWQAMLMAADLPQTNTIVINGFISGDGGVKMSKSLGNVINPYDVVSEYGTDALRYFVLRELSPFEDSPFTMERFKDAYNANLANGIGNLTSRIMKMAEANLDGPVKASENTLTEEYLKLYETFELNKVMDYVWGKIGELDKTIQEKEPFKLVKVDREAGVKLITELVVKLYSIARMLNPLLPETSTKIKEAVKANKAPSEPLFLRKV